MARRHLEDWFVPGDGINYDVITTNVKRFLGSDASVRQGDKSVDGRLVLGYWVRASRSPTSAMIDDWRAYTLKYYSEQRRAGARIEYEDSRTHRESGYYDGGSRYTPPPPHDYESSRPRYDARDPRAEDRDYDRAPPRNDPYARAQYDGRPPHNERAGYEYGPTHSPHPGTGGDPYAPPPNYQSAWPQRDGRDSRDHRDYPPQQHPGQSGYPPRGYDSVDSRYRDDTRYREREDQRYAGRDDSRRDDYRYTGRDDPRRDDSRYPPDSRSSRDYAYPPDSRHPTQDRYADERRYQDPGRQSGRPPAGYGGAPPPQQPGYPFMPPPPGAMPMPVQLPPIQSPPMPMPHIPPPSYPINTIYDQYGRPVALATPLPPPHPQEPYAPNPFPPPVPMPQPLQGIPAPPQPNQSPVQDPKDPNMSRKRGAPEDKNMRQRQR